MTTCWKQGFSSTESREYWINVEKGLSQWGTPILWLDGWQMHMSRSDPNQFYYESPTGVTQWNQPDYTDSPPLQLPQGWERIKTVCGNYYYLNKSLKISQWEHPGDIKIPTYITTVLGGLVPRGLNWIDNSCYLDSILFCLFASPKTFIDDMLNKNLDNISQEIKDDSTTNFCGKDSDADIDNRKQVQKQLKNIYNSITRKGKPVEDCSEFRRSIVNCRGLGDEDPYHTAEQGDAGDFLVYLFKILPVKKAIKKIIEYGTDDLSPSPSNPTEISTVYDKSSVVYVVDNNILLDLPETGSYISDLIKEINDSGEQYYDKTYKRLIQIRTIVSAPIIVVSVKRLIEEKPKKKICYTSIYPDETISIEDGTKFSLYAVVMHTGGCHYVCVAKYDEIWYYFDDVPYGKDQTLKKFNTFEDVVDASFVDGSGILNPLTHGTQYFYKPYDEAIHNFIVGNKYERDIDGEPDILEYLGIEDCQFIKKYEFPQIIYPEDFSYMEESEIQNIKNTKCHVFHSFEYGGEDERIIVSDTYNLGKIKIHIPPVDFLSSLSNFEKVDIPKLEQSSIITLKKLFLETYYESDKKRNQLFTKYSGKIASHNFRLSYISRDGNTFIEEKSKEARYEGNRELLRVLSITPKAESDFYVFRGTWPRAGYEYLKIISGEVTEEKMFGSISTTILSSFATKQWTNIKVPCCLYLIKVPKNENYLILDDVFTDELEFNNKSQYEVTLAPGKITFTEIKKITIDGSEKVLFVCNYKSFTEEEFNDGFDGPIYNIR